MTKDEALRLASEAMESFQNGTNGLYEGEFEEEITAIKAALEAKDEPVAWKTDDIELYVREDKFGFYNIPLYTHPPQRTWVGLTDEDIEEEFGFIDELLRDCVQRTEAKFKEKNT